MFPFIVLAALVVLLLVIYLRLSTVDQNGQGNIFRFSPSSTQIMGGEI